MPEQRDQFQNRVKALVEQVRQWVEPHEWVTKPYTKKLRDLDSQIYLIPALFSEGPDQGTSRPGRLRRAGGRGRCGSVPYANL